MAVKRKDTAKVRFSPQSHTRKFEYIHSSQLGAPRRPFVVMKSESQDIGEQDWRWCDADAYMQALACALPRFDHRLDGRWLPAAAVRPRPIALRWPRNTFCERLLAIDAHHARAQCGWMASTEDMCRLSKEMHHSPMAIPQHVSMQRQLSPPYPIR